MTEPVLGDSERVTRLRLRVAAKEAGRLARCVGRAARHACADGRGTEQAGQWRRAVGVLRALDRAEGAARGEGEARAAILVARLRGGCSLHRTPFERRKGAGIAGRCAVVRRGVGRGLRGRGIAGAGIADRRRAAVRAARRRAPGPTVTSTKLASASAAWRTRPLTSCSGRASGIFARRRSPCRPCTPG
jgi:hypothetical protein